MTPIENFIAPRRKRYCDRCKELSCLFNVRFVPEQAVSAWRGIPVERCPNILFFVPDDEFEVNYRALIESIVVDGKPLSVPPEFVEFWQSQREKYAEPFSPVEYLIDGAEGPTVASD